ncbi:MULTISPECIES: hypothetical protein [Clostridium]|uniref:hypothetical protein n=1 Tax=Clostridium TaxID=1485 RepID=UPI000824A637|nr:MULTISPECIES: hypothetical protein [Clostridium]PJI06566.1 hypothetical protein CUB90_01210 [Clostridium sp. CT7]
MESCEKIMDDLSNNKRIVVVTYDVDRLKNIDLKDKKVKVYDNLKRMYSFRNDLTIVKIHQNTDSKFNEIEVKILLILFKSALRQKVDYVYMSQKFKAMLNDPQFEEYKKFIKYIGK